MRYVRGRGSALCYRALVVPTRILVHQRSWEIVGIRRWTLNLRCVTYVGVMHACVQGRNRVPSPMSLDFVTLLGWIACAHVHPRVTPMLLACGVELGGCLTYCNHVAEFC